MEGNGRMRRRMGRERKGREKEEKGIGVRRRDGKRK